MSNLFHISKDGEARPCSAERGNCPLGGEHFPTIEEARAKAEQQLADQHGTFPQREVSPLGDGAYKADNGDLVLDVSAAELRVYNDYFGYNIVDHPTIIGGWTDGYSNVDRVAFTIRDQDGNVTDDEQDEVAQYVLDGAHMVASNLGREGRSPFIQWALKGGDIDYIKKNMLFEESYGGRTYIFPFLAYK